MRALKIIPTMVFVCSIGIPMVSAQELQVIAWNMETGGADPAVLANQIEQFQGIDLWGFSEVRNRDWALAFTEAAAEGEQAEFRMILGTTGRGDRLLIVYNASLLEEIRHEELHDINPQGRVRAPLVAQFRVIRSDTEFLFMVNHLYRSRPNRRHEQSEALNAWAQPQTLPIIAVGDYNYDWEVPGGDTDHDAGFDLLTANRTFTWVRPGTLIPTQCHTQFHSVLDFVFVTQPVQGWNPTATIEMAQPGYCPDDDTTSDHRPILATFNLSVTEEAGLRQRMLRRIGEIQEELRELEGLVEELPTH